MGRCFHQPGKKVTISHRLSGDPPLSVNPVECLSRSHHMAENIPGGLAIGPSPGKTHPTSGTVVALPLACLAEPKADFAAGASLAIDD
jgi:hypothetical protein